MEELLAGAPGPDLPPPLRCGCKPDPRGPLFTKHSEDCPEGPLSRAKLDPFEELRGDKPGSAGSGGRQRPEDRRRGKGPQVARGDQGS